MICEPRSNTYADVTYSTRNDNGGGSGENGYIHMSSTGGYSAYSPIWNNTKPTSSLITLGNAANVNSNGATYICYAWQRNTRV